jgi:hypothetical protein
MSKPLSFRESLSDDFRGPRRHDGVWGHIPDHQSARSDDGPLANSYAMQNDRTMANPHIVFNHYRSVYVTASTNGRHSWLFEAMIAPDHGHVRSYHDPVAHLHLTCDATIISDKAMIAYTDAVRPNMVVAAHVEIASYPSEAIFQFSEEKHTELTQHSFDGVHLHRRWLDIVQIHFCAITELRKLNAFYNGARVRSKVRTQLHFDFVMKEF